MNWLGKISDTLSRAEGFISELDSSAARVAAARGLIDAGGGRSNDEAEEPIDAAMEEDAAEPAREPRDLDEARTPATGHPSHRQLASTPVHGAAPTHFAEPAPRPREAPAAPATPQTAQAPPRPTAHSHDDAARVGDWAEPESASVPTDSAPSEPCATSVRRRARRSIPRRACTRAPPAHTPSSRPRRAA